MALKKTRVLIVDDSLFMRQFISASISKDAGIEVVGEAANPFEARDKILELKPDVMTLDVDMPKMNGLEFLRKLMPQYPLPVLVVSSTPTVVLDAMQAGAVDFVAKPAAMEEGDAGAFIAELVIKIKIASISKVGQFKRKAGLAELVERSSGAAVNESLLVAIGASTGGTEATANILNSLKSFSAGVVVVQHMPPVFTKMYAERLNNTCALEVKEAEDGDIVLPGRVLIAPGDFQMEVERSGKGYRVKCFKGEKVSGHCPSVDVLFESAAKAAGANALGIILTGMGSDGAKGLLSMRKKGAFTIGQNKETCVVYGMPMVANNVGAVQAELPLSEISSRMCRWHDEMTGGK
ncbi:MAG TPA: chemotaxis response regulator protein-glutamate methylesterase [Feifaniaceae bacterium]|nr:chemotaxis response regulator protein-glutamate methylesterase [Feifaniaceae bacterium]